MAQRSNQNHSTTNSTAGHRPNNSPGRTGTVRAETMRQTFGPGFQMPLLSEEALTHTMDRHSAPPVRRPGIRPGPSLVMLARFFGVVDRLWSRVAGRFWPPGPGPSGVAGIAGITQPNFSCRSANAACMPRCLTA